MNYFYALITHKDSQVSKATGILALIAVIISFCDSVLAIDRVWTNASNNQLWNDPQNWSPVGIPNLADSVNTAYNDVLIIPVGYHASVKHVRMLGSLEIAATASLSINDGYLFSVGDITNSGSITVNNSPKQGIFHSSQTTGIKIFENEGEIFINNASWQGIEVQNGERFTNKADAEIAIENSGLESLKLGGIFQNIGIFRARGSSIETGLLIEASNGSLTNFACARMVIGDKITLLDGQVTNFGFFRQNYVGDNDVDIVISNIGVFEDLGGSLGFPDISDDGTWVAPITQGPFHEGRPKEVFGKGSSVDYNYSNVFLEDGLLTNAGSYDGSSNLWRPNSNAVGESTFFMEVEYTSASCKDTLRFETIEPIEGFNYWVGPSTGFWNFGINWSRGSVPTGSEQVGIFESDAVVNINFSGTAKAQGIILKGTLNINSNGILEVGGGNEGITIDEGNFSNNGVLNISNTVFGINATNSSVSNQGVLSCTTNDYCINVSKTTNGLANFTNSGSLSSVGGRLILGDDTPIVNSGTLTAQKVPANSNAISTLNLENMGTILLEGLAVSNNTGYRGFVTNLPMGALTIGGFQTGAIVQGTNAGSIEISNCTTGISLDHDFDNATGGDILIEDRQTGIFNQFDLMRNSGIISINNASSTGLLLSNDFENLESGQFLISNSGDTGILLSGVNADLITGANSELRVVNSLNQGIKADGGEILVLGNSIIRVW